MLRRAPLLLLLMLLSACGFHLRGHGGQPVHFPFHSIYIKTSAETPVVTALRQGLINAKIEVVDSPEKADITLDVAYEVMDKKIVALSGSGHVIDYMLTYRVSLRAYDRQYDDWLPTTEIALQRDLPYDDTQVLAKEQEEAMLYKEMRTDIAQQIVRRLSLVKPPPPQPK